jgi:hypothetical protein
VKDTSTFSDTSHYMQADARSPRNKFHVPVECDHNARTGAHNLPSDTPGLPHINRWFHHDRITLIPEHRGKHGNTELSPYRVAFLAAVMRQNITEINAETYSTS